MANLEYWQRNHWMKRWSRSKLDHFMGGRGLTPINRRAADIVASLKPRAVVDVGAGTFRVLKYIHSLDPSIRLAATEIDFPNVRTYLKPFIEPFLSMVPYPLPWPDDTFDVAYQNNTLANLRSRHVEPTVREIARVAHTFVFGAGWGSRFWEGSRKATRRDKNAWMHAVIEKYFEFVSRESDFGITVWRAKRPIPPLDPQVVEGTVLAQPKSAPCITKYDPNNPNEGKTD